VAWKRQLPGAYFGTRLAKYIYLEKQFLIPYFNRNTVLILSLNQRGFDGRKRDIRKQHGISYWD
jgi:hypothetical protein